MTANERQIELDSSIIMFPNKKLSPITTKSVSSGALHTSQYQLENTALYVLNNQHSNVVVNNN